MTFISLLRIFIVLHMGLNTDKMAGGIKSSMWPAVWFVVIGLVNIGDVVIVALRHYSLPGQDLNYLFPGYVARLKVVQTYLEMKDPFLWALTYAKIGETLIGFIAAFQIVCGSPSGILTGLVCATMTFWKTTLYLLRSAPFHPGETQFADTDWRDYLSYYLLPVSIWWVFPLLCMLYFSGKIRRAFREAQIAAKGKMKKVD